MGVKKPKQRVAKKPVAEALLAARELKEEGEPKGARKTGEPAPTARDLGEKKKRGSKEGPGGIGEIGESVSAAGNPGRGGEKQGNQRQQYLYYCLGLAVGKLLLWLLLALGIASPSSIAYFFLKDLFHHSSRYCPQP